MLSNNFIKRHNGPRKEQLAHMLDAVGVESLDQLIDETVPQAIRLNKDLKLDEGISEYEYIQQLKEIGSKNRIFKTYIGLGYYDTITPGVIPASNSLATDTPMPATQA